MKKFKDSNDRTTSVGLNDKDEITLQTEQNVDALIEQNKKEYNNAETKWSDQLLGKIGRVHV